MKGLCNGTPFTIEKILASDGARTHDRKIGRQALNAYAQRKINKDRFQYTDSSESLDCSSEQGRHCSEF